MSPSVATDREHEQHLPPICTPLGARAMARTRTVGNQGYAVLSARHRGVIVRGPGCQPGRWARRLHSGHKVIFRRLTAVLTAH